MAHKNANAHIDWALGPHLLLQDLRACPLCPLELASPRGRGERTGLPLGYRWRPGPASALRVAKSPSTRFTARALLLLVFLTFSVHLRPGWGLVQCHCFLDSSPQLSLFLLSNLGQNNIPPAHQLMQRRSWEEEESGRTFILALGHLARPAAFSHCLYGKCLLIPQTTKGPTCSWVSVVFRGLIYSLHRGWTLTMARLSARC